MRPFSPNILTAQQNRKRLIRLSPVLAVLPLGVAVAQTGGNEPARLTPLVVTAAGFEQEVKEAPASITVISREELEEKRVSNIAEALRDVEGIDVGAPTGKTGGMNISIRGMPSEYTLVLIDGRRQNVAGNVTPNGFGETSTSFMPPISAIERIEIIRGPMSTLYGSDAMGGVINIITRKVAREWGGEVGVESTFHQDNDFGDSRAVNMYLSGPLVQDRLGLQLRGRYFQRDDSDLTFTDEAGNQIPLYTRGFHRGASPVEADVYNVGARLTFTPNRDHDLWIDGEINRQAFDNSKGQLGNLDDPNGVIYGYADELRFEREQFAIGHTSRFGIGTLESSLMRNTTETIGRTIPGSRSGGDYGQPYPGFPNMVIGHPRTLETTNLVFDTKFVAPIGDHVLTVGGQWWDAEMTDGLATEDFEQTTWALFTEDEWFLRDDLALTLGARYDRHDAFGGHFSPRAYLVWSVTPNWTIKGGVGTGYKTPSLNDLHDGINGVTGQGATLTIGNPDLEPEKSINSEIGVRYDSPNGFMVSATVFHNEFDDKIASGGERVVTGHPSIPDGTYEQLVNIDEAVTRGLELATRSPLAPAWTLSATYTYTDSEQKSGPNKGDPLTNTPEHQLNATLRWNVTERFNAWLSGEYVSERYRSRQRAQGGPTRDELGDYKAYALFHMGGSYQLSPQLTLRATVYNLFDKDFIDYRRYEYLDKNSNTVVNYANVYANAEPGRRLWLSLSYNF